MMVEQSPGDPAQLTTSQQRSSLPASVFDPFNVAQAAAMGRQFRSLVFPSLVLRSRRFRHPLTDIGIEKFLADARDDPPPT